MGFWDVSIIDYLHLLIAHILLEARPPPSRRGAGRGEAGAEEGGPGTSIAMVPHWNPLGIL